MPDIKKILCAVDFSEYSPQVAVYAKSIAKCHDATILVFYATPSLTQYMGFHVPVSSIENFVEEVVSSAEETMESFIKEHFAGVAASGRTTTGYAAEEILKLAGQENIDMIIVGTHGRKGIDRILFGSVAEKVVKNASCPVLTVRPV